MIDIVTEINATTRFYTGGAIAHRGLMQPREPLFLARVADPV